MIANLGPTSLNGGEPIAYEKAVVRDAFGAEWARVEFGYDVLEAGRIVASRFAEGYVERKRLCGK